MCDSEQDLSDWKQKFEDLREVSHDSDTVSPFSRWDELFSVVGADTDALKEQTVSWLCLTLHSLFQTASATHWEQPTKTELEQLRRVRDTAREFLDELDDLEDTFGSGPVDQLLGALGLQSKFVRTLSESLHKNTLPPDSPQSSDENEAPRVELWMRAEGSDETEAETIVPGSISDTKPIIRSGVSAVKETLSRYLQEAPDPKKGQQKSTFYKKRCAERFGRVFDAVVHFKKTGEKASVDYIEVGGPLRTSKSPGDELPAPTNSDRVKFVQMSLKAVDFHHSSERLVEKLLAGNW